MGDERLSYGSYGYTGALIARTAVEAARRVVAGEVSPCFQTLASAFGPDFPLEFEGVEREDRDVLAEVGPSVGEWRRRVTHPRSSP